MEILDMIKSPEELLQFMNNNIKYGFVGKNGKKYTNMYSPDWNDWYQVCYVQNARDVLNSKIGTCWDQVELERAWFEKNNYAFKTIFIWFEVYGENDLPSHTFLIYEKDGKYYWFEHAFESFKGIHEFNSEHEAIEFVKEKQFEFALKNSKNAKLEDRAYLMTYEYSKPKDHLDVDEYLMHVTSNKYSENKHL